MTATVLRDCTLLDCTGADPVPRSTVIVEGDRIARVARGSEPVLPRDARVVDCAGRTLMPRTRRVMPMPRRWPRRRGCR